MVDKPINILIPMAGAGKRFLVEGYNLPKPLIDVDNVPMISKVINNLNIKNGRYIFIIQQQHDLEFNLTAILKKIEPSCEIIVVDHLTDGPACTALLAEHFIDDNNLIIINCDQIINDFDISKLLEFAAIYNADGILGTFISNSNKNSYVKLNSEGLITDVKEKIVISNIATNGLHFWKNGLDFLFSAKNMIANNERYNNEFYIAPTYNSLIKQNKKILPYFYNLHIPIGTPADLLIYKKLYGNS
jgi:dTDP-glucose pyrophosphorylase